MPVQEENAVGQPEEQTSLLAQVAARSRKDINPASYKIKAFLGGRSGSGKTQGSVTIPGKKLVVDFDGRAETVKDYPETEVIDCYFGDDPKSPKPWLKAEEIRNQITSEITRGVFPFQGVIFDGVTMMGRLSMNWALTLDSGRGLGGAPARQHYLPQMDTLSRFILTTKSFPIHIIYTGHIELHEDELTGTHKFYPKITGKLRTELENWFNETYYCYRDWDSEEQKTRYYWMTAGSGRREFFKSSLNTLGRYWKDPIELDFDKPLVGFADLLERRFKS